MTGIAGLMETMSGEARYAPTVLADKTCGLMTVQALTRREWFGLRCNTPPPLRASCLQPKR